MKINLEQLKDTEQDLLDFSDVKTIDGSETLPSDLILDKKYVIGMFYVLSIDFKMPILYGATHQNMLVGGWHTKSKPSDGRRKLCNCRA